MAVYTVNTTTRQDEVLARLLPVVNADRGTRGLTILDAQGLLREMSTSQLDAHIQADDEVFSKALFVAYRAAPQATVDQVDTLLGTKVAAAAPTGAIASFFSRLLT